MNLHAVYAGECETREAWTTPGAHEVAPGVYRLPLPMPGDSLRAANVYALCGDAGELVLIDAGQAVIEAERQLVSSLDSIGHALADVSEFLVTHAHRDHYTLAAAVRARFGTGIAIGEAERVNMEAINHRSPQERMPQLELLRAAGAAHLAAAMADHDVPFDNTFWALPDRWLDDRTPIDVPGRSLVPLHTPGHTRGHFVFLDRDANVLFAGDHVLPHITPSIGFEQVPHRSPLSEYLASLELLRQMPDARLLPGHGPASQSVHARVDELLSHHEQRLEASMIALSVGASTGWEVADRLTWTRRARRLAELDPFNQMLAVLETSAHLELLAERRHVHRAVEADGVVRFGEW
jgi:glyoxylase-like metal-dependent hydrolase (beta-lactamase superfamily II)